MHKRIRVAVVALLFAVVTTLTVDALAHKSSYCGHYNSGIAKSVHFIDQHRHYYSAAGGSVVGWSHHHVYQHGNTYGADGYHVVYHKKCKKH